MEGSVVDAIKEALTNEDVSLGYGSYDDKVIVYLAECLKDNTTATSLYLSGNSFGAEGTCALAQILAGNKTLKSLNIAGSKPSEAGIKALTEALKVNSSLEYLNLDNVVSIPDDVAPFDFDNFLIPLIEGLKLNQGLKTVIFTSDYLTDKAIPSICSLLTENKMLQTLKFQYNFFSEEGLLKLKEAAEQNPNLIEFVLELKY